MVGYGVHASFRHPELTHNRLSHVYYQTENAQAAEKRTGLLEVGEVRERWSRVEGVVREMTEIARVDRPDDAPANRWACNAFYDVCPHSEYCVRSMTFQQIFQMRGETMGNGLFDVPASQLNGAQTVSPLAGAGQSSLGLFGGAPPPPVPAITPPPLSDEEHAARVAAERARIEAVEATTYGSCAACGTALTAANASRLQSGVLKHFGCPRAVNPPDGPVPDLVVGAEPLPPEVVAQITDPEIRRRAEEHAAQVQARAAEEAAARPPEEKKSSGKCPAGGQRVTLSQEQAAKKKYPCATCGKVVGIKPSSDFTEATLPGHMRPRADEVVAAVVPEVPALPPVPAVLQPPPLPQSVASTSSTILPPPLPPVPEVPAPSQLKSRAREFIDLAVKSPPEESSAWALLSIAESLADMSERLKRAEEQEMLRSGI